MNARARSHVTTALDYLGTGHGTPAERALVHALVAIVEQLGSGACHGESCESCIDEKRVSW